MSEGKARIGFVGVGLMGHGAAKFILQAGHELTVIAHRNRRPIDDLVRRGAKEATSVEALTEASDIVFLCLPDAARVEQVMRAPEGVLAGARAGHLIVDMTTSLPELTVGFNHELAAQGIGFIDGPMNRSPSDAERGALNLLLGGSDEQVARVRPVVETFSENVWHVGPAGAAHGIKLVNNFLLISNLATVLEAAVAAERFGISHQALLDICSQGGANSAILRRLLPYPIEGDDSGFQAKASTILKDVSYYNKMADEAGLHSTMSKAAQSFFRLACSLGEGDTMVPRLYDSFKMLNALNDEN